MKPGDFLLNVTDFFAVLLPGTMATWLLARHVPRAQLLDFLGVGSAPDTTTFWVLFVFSSFFLGQFVFMLSSELDEIYDRWRVRRRPVASDYTFLAATMLRRRLTADLSEGLSLLKWCKAYIQVQAPGARVEIDRLEADSKFFRAMVVIAALFSVHFLFCQWQPFVGVFCVLIVVPAFVRYTQQRWKMTELSYGTAVIVGATRPAAASGPAAVAESD